MEEGMNLIDNGRWHLDRRVSVGHIVTTLIMLGGFAVWMIALEHRLTAAETRIENLVSNQTLYYHEIIRRLERIEDRLNVHTINE